MSACILIQPQFLEFKRDYEVSVVLEDDSKLEFIATYTAITRIEESRNISNAEVNTCFLRYRTTLVCEVRQLGGTISIQFNYLSKTFGIYFADGNCADECSPELKARIDDGRERIVTSFENLLSVGHKRLEFVVWQAFSGKTKSVSVA